MAIMPDVYAILRGLAGTSSPASAGTAGTVGSGVVTPGVAPEMIASQPQIPIPPTPEQQVAISTNLGQNLPLVPVSASLPAPLPQPTPAVAEASPQLPPVKATSSPSSTATATATGVGQQSVASLPSWLQGITGVGLEGQALQDWQNMAAFGSLLSLLGAGIGGNDTSGGRFANAANQYIQGAISGVNDKQAQQEQNKVMRSMAGASAKPSPTASSSKQPSASGYQSPDTSSRGKPAGGTSSSSVQPTSAPAQPQVQQTAMISPYDDYLRRLAITSLV